MCNFDKNFQANLDYWIYCSCKLSKAETIEELQDLIIFGIKEPNEILLDLVRSLQKLEAMSEEEFDENNDKFPYQRKYYEQLKGYSETIEILREIESEKWAENLSHDR